MRSISSEWLGQGRICRTLDQRGRKVSRVNCPSRSSNESGRGSHRFTAMPNPITSCDNARARSIDRRTFISRIAAAGMGSLACSGANHLMWAFAPRPVVTKRGLIDVHHHFVPPFYLSENRDRIAAAGGGRTNPAYFSWTPEQAMAAMDNKGVATAVLSLTAPGVWFGDPQTAAQTAR